jgi:hypothetical protein
MVRVEGCADDRGQAICGASVLAAAILSSIRLLRRDARALHTR